MIYKDNDGWKHKKNHLNYSNKILLRRWPSLYVTLARLIIIKISLTIFAWLAILTCVHQGTIRMHFLSSQHNGPSIIPWRNFKTLRWPYSGPYPGHKLSDPGHSSNTFRLDSSWPHSSSLLNRFLPGVTGEFHKLKHNIFKAQSIPQKSWPKTKYHNTSECITIWHACCKPPKIVHAKY